MGDQDEFLKNIHLVEHNIKNKTTIKINICNFEKRQYQRRTVSFVLKKWREPQFIDLWIGLTGLRTSMDSSVYFHSLWCSDDFSATWMAVGLTVIMHNLFIGL